MGKLNKDNSGFGGIEFLLVAVIIVLLGVVGWFVYRDHNKTTTTKISTSTKTIPTKPTPAIATTPNPYAGWKTATLQYEQISYRYPSNWTLSGSSSAATAGDGYTPGVDNFTLTSPDNNTITLITGTGGGGVATNLDHQTIKVLNNNDYLVVLGHGISATQASYACVESQLTDPSSYILDKNISASSTGDGGVSPGQLLEDKFCYYSSEPVSISTFENSSDFSTAKLIFESMKYN